MNEDPRSKTFWFRPSGGDLYLIPDDTDVPAGELELRTLTGGKRSVDAEAVKQWAADEARARDHLTTAARAGITKFGEELGAAWKRGLDAASKAADAVGKDAKTSRAEPPATESGGAESTEERAKRQLEDAAKAFMAALKEISTELEAAARQPKSENDSVKKRP